MAYSGILYVMRVLILQIWSYKKILDFPTRDKLGVIISIYLSISTWKWGNVPLPGNGIFTVTGVCDWAGGSEIYLQEWILIHSNVCGDHIAGAGLFNED